MAGQNHQPSSVCVVFSVYRLVGLVVKVSASRAEDPGFFLFFGGVFCVPQLYLWGSPLLGEIFAYVTIF